MATQCNYLERAMFGAFVDTLDLEGAWYEYSWQELRPRFATRRNWWGRKYQVELVPDKVVKTSGRRRLKFTVEGLALRFDMPEAFTAELRTHDLQFDLYVQKFDTVPFVRHRAASTLRPGETFQHSVAPVIGIGEPTR